MDNSQFRNLLNSDNPSNGASRRDGTLSVAKTSLGSRSRMAPRSLAGRSTKDIFAKQIAANADRDSGGPPAKRFKSAAVPRGTKLAQGYSDRTGTRTDEEQDGKIKKLKELELMVKEEKIDQATFEKLREQMGIGGDLSTTHLVKGLDFKLLERARQGEDLNKSQKESQQTVQDAGHLDDALDDALQRGVVARKREDTSHTDTENGAEEPPAAMSRDDILRKLKASRTAQQSAPEPALGDRFKKLKSADKPGKKKFVETVDGRRREVLLVTQADGSTKRKTRWLDPEHVAPKDSKVAKPLGMEVPAEFVAKQKALEAAEAAEDEDDDIFQGVGAEYDPLADMDSDAEAQSAESTQERLPPSDQPVKRNYFGDTDKHDTEEAEKSKKRDETLMAAFRKAAAIRNEESEKIPEPDDHRSDRSKQFLAKLKEQEAQDRRDLDLGFGGDNRYGDDDDEDGPIYEEGDKEESKPKRKRGGKKRKGDKDNVADVMSVLEGRKR